MSRLKRLCVIMVILGVMLIGMAIVDLIDNSKVPLSFGNLKVSQLKNGKIVEGDVPINLGCFQESYRTRYGIKSSSSNYYYVVFVEDKAIGLRCTGETHEALEKQANAFLNHTGDDAPDLESVPIKGKIRKMDSETRGHLEEYLYDDESGTNIAEIEPYVINNGILSTAQSMIMIGIGVALIAIPLLVTVLSWKSGNRSSRTA
ncbi:MAG: hypothetical protein J1E62_09605 [Lachnospiraceae bacterium]|nr:hypothetical protein [Lachnospiraceae bacterium]